MIKHWVVINMLEITANVAVGVLLAKIVALSPLKRIENISWLFETWNADKVAKNLFYRVYVGSRRASSLAKKTRQPTKTGKSVRVQCRLSGWEMHKGMTWRMFTNSVLALNNIFVTVVDNLKITQLLHRNTSMVNSSRRLNLQLYVYSFRDF